MHRKNKNKSKKTIQKLIDKEENTLQNNEDILKECKNFYENLYKKSKTCLTTQNLLLEKLDPKLSTEQNQRLIKPIDILEIKCHRKYGK